MNDIAIPVHPGEILREMLAERGLSQTGLAKHLGLPASTIHNLCQGRRGVSAEMAVMLGTAFGISPLTWLNLQKNWELSQVNQQRLAKVQPLQRRAS